MFYPLLESIVNEAIQSDKQTLSKLTALSGQLIAVEIEPIKPILYVSITPVGIDFLDQISDDQHINLSITLSAKTVLKLSRYRFDHSQLEPGELNVSGDPIVAQKFLQIVSELNIDWEQLLSEHLGDEPAYYLKQAGKNGKLVFDYTKQRMQDWVKASIQSPDSIIANPSSTEAYLDGVDDIRARTESLLIRLQRIQDTLGNETQL